MKRPFGGEPVRLCSHRNLCGVVSRPGGDAALNFTEQSARPFASQPEKSARRRNKAHLAFVASQPCLVCKRTPCDPHHLKIAQPRSLARRSVTNTPCGSAVSIIGICIVGAMKRTVGRSKELRRYQSQRSLWAMTHGGSDEGARIVCNEVPSSSIVGELSGGGNVYSAPEP